MRRREFLAEGIESLHGRRDNVDSLRWPRPADPKSKSRMCRSSASASSRSWAPPFSRARASRTVGDLITLIQTDAGLTGFGPGANPAMLSAARERLIGADPLDMQRLAPPAVQPGRGVQLRRSGANVEIALWDLVGKVLELPLYRLWGGRDGKLMPYASQWSTGTPDERARMAQTVRAHNWRAIKFRSHFPTDEGGRGAHRADPQAHGGGFHHPDRRQPGRGWAGRCELGPGAMGLQARARHGSRVCTAGALLARRAAAALGFRPARAAAPRGEMCASRRRSAARACTNIAACWRRTRSTSFSSRSPL